MRGVVAVIEDDVVLLRNLQRGLAAEGFTVAWTAGTGATALAHASRDSRPDAVIMDLGLPDADGLDLMGALRARGIDAPVLVLSARGSTTDTLLSLGSGADDHVAKPFALAEVAARLDVMIRRRKGGAPPVDLALDPAAHEVVAGDRAMGLGPTDFRLLSVLLARRGEVVRRATLVAATWAPGAAVTDNMLDRCVSRIRHALRTVGSAVTVDTVRGVGYRLH